VAKVCADIPPRRRSEARNRLERELAATRARGYAFEEEETVDGVACVAAPLALLGEPLAAISVSVPVHRFPEARRTALTLAVQQIAQPAALTSA
jgi:DNA-binding IclR family transcriptional regulator